ncbi:hypothetical protein Emed_003771 [Eimeria media]
MPNALGYFLSSATLSAFLSPLRLPKPSTLNSKSQMRIPAGAAAAARTFAAAAAATAAAATTPAFVVGAAAAAAAAPKQAAFIRHPPPHRVVVPQQRTFCMYRDPQQQQQQQQQQQRAAAHSMGLQAAGSDSAVLRQSASSSQSSSSSQSDSCSSSSSSGSSVRVALGMNHEFGVYIHLPFCLRRCHFCTFPISLLPNSSAAAAAAAAAAYLPLLQQEMLAEFEAFLKPIKRRIKQLQQQQQQLLQQQQQQPRCLSLSEIEEGLLLPALLPIAALNTRSIDSSPSGAAAAAQPPAATAATAAAAAATHGRRLLRSVYFGGGTPSLMPPEMLQQLLQQIQEFENELKRLLLQEQQLLPSYMQQHQQQQQEPQEPEVSIEIYPGTLDAARLSAYLSLGINRFSLGVQTFHEPTLRVLGRYPACSSSSNSNSSSNISSNISSNSNSSSHSADSLRTLRLLRDFGLLQQTSVDLIWSVQTPRLLLRDLRLLTSLRVGHISLYELQHALNSLSRKQCSVSAGSHGHASPASTRLHKSSGVCTPQQTQQQQREQQQHRELQQQQQHDQQQLQQQQQHEEQQQLKQQGVQHQQEEGVQRRSRRCMHSQLYWGCQPVFAFGVGAASFVRGQRRVNPSSLKAYAALVRQKGDSEETDAANKHAAAAAAAEAAAEGGGLQSWLYTRIQELLMMGLRTAEGIDLLHLLSLSQAAAAAEQQPGGHLEAAAAAVGLLQQPTATLQQLLLSAAACADVHADFVAAAAATEAAAAAANIETAAAAGRRSAAETKNSLFMLQQVLPSVLRGAADFLLRPGVAEVRVYVHPTCSANASVAALPHEQQQQQQSACNMLQPLLLEGFEFDPVGEEVRLRVRPQADTKETVVSRVLQLLHAVQRHRSSSSNSSNRSVGLGVRLLLLPPDGFLLSDAVARDIFFHLDEALNSQQPNLELP